MNDKQSQTLDNTRRRSLASRLIAIIAATAFGLVLVSSIVLYWGTQQVLNVADDQVIEKRINLVADLLKSATPDEGLVAHEVSEDNQGPRQIFVRIISDIEAIALETPGMLMRVAPADFPDAGAMPAGRLQRLTIRSAKGDTYRAAAMRVPVGSKPTHHAIIQAATDTTLDREGLSWLRWLLAGVIAAALPVTAIASWLLVKHHLKPLDRITAAAQRVDSATSAHRLELAGLPLELFELGSQFNAMLDRLEQTWSELKHYADTIAHEMRTPINRLQLQSEIALRDAGSVEALRSVVICNIEECQRLTRMLKALLFLARADSKQAAIHPQLLRLAIELATIVQYFEASASEEGKSITLACSEDLALTADRELLQRAVGNLIANAIVHTPVGGKISLSVEKVARPRPEIVIEVHNSGVGISREDQARIFDRFYRGAQGTQSTSSDNLGLGLAIVKSVMELHGGKVSLQSTPGCGAAFRLHFPLKEKFELEP